MNKSVKGTKAKDAKNHIKHNKYEMNTKGEFSNADYRYIGEKLPYCTETMLRW